MINQSLKRRPTRASQWSNQKINFRRSQAKPRFFKREAWWWLEVMTRRKWRLKRRVKQSKRKIRKVERLRKNWRMRKWKSNPPILLR
jgi:hypothetical protein